MAAMEKKAVALLSGGLDSVLAVRVILEQGIKVTALRFLTPFGCDAIGGGGCGHDVSGLPAEMGFELKYCHIDEQYIKMVMAPEHGWGKNMNPCIDCRIIMLSKAKEYMALGNGSFIVTGEVLGQRPMSQRRDSFHTIDRAAGLEGYIVRPLSAKLLPPTIPEKEGIVDRERLLDINGRSRKRQYQLAAQFGISDFGQPAGGCLLTEPNYSERLRDLFKHVKNPAKGDIGLLRIGRHFRPSERCKIIVGRNYEENLAIENLLQEGDALLQPVDFKGPATLLHGTFGEEDLTLAARLTVRYGDVDDGGTGTVEVVLKEKENETPRNIKATGADNSVLELRIGLTEDGRRKKKKSDPLPANEKESLSPTQSPPV